MQLYWKKRGRVLYASLEGELDQHNAGDLRDKLNRLLEDDGIERIEYELSGVTFMDSSGIGVLLGRYRTLEKRHGSMDVKGASRAIERILRMAGIYGLCTKEDSVNEK